MSPSAREYLQHILDEVAYLATKVRGLDKASFVRDPTLKRAFVRSLEIIGEAAKQVPESVRQLAPQIDWRAVSGMRDRLIHSYFGVDYDIVWDVATNKAPTLEREVRRLLEEEQV